jgi:hypothetical protein
LRCRENTVSTNQRDPEKEALWRERIAKWKASRQVHEETRKVFEKISARRLECLIKNLVFQFAHE